MRFGTINIYLLFQVGNDEEKEVFLCVKITDAIIAFGFECKVRKVSEKAVANEKKQLRYIPVKFLLPQAPAFPISHVAFCRKRE